MVVARLLAAGLVPVIVCGLLQAVPAAAQTLQPSPPPLTTTLTADVLRALPAGATLFSILETTQPEIAADRFNSGGLNAGDPARIAGFLGSWSQTAYRVGDADLASPRDGSPLLFPDLAFWQAASIATGAMPADVPASALAVTLEPQRAGSRWTGVVEGSGAGGGMTSRGGSASGVPSIAALREWAHGSALVSGPASNRLGVAFGGSWARNAIVERADPAARESHVASVYGHAVYAVSPALESRTLVWWQRAHAESRDRSLHVQASVGRKDGNGDRWRLFGAYSQRRRSPRGERPEFRVIDRVNDGPVTAFADVPDGLERLWAVGIRLAPARSFGRHRLEWNGEVDRGTTESLAFAGLIGELVDGVPARLWDYRAARGRSVRRSTTATGLVSDRVQLSSHLSLAAAFGAEWVHGRAAGAADEVTWTSWLPSVMLRWDLGTPYQLTLVTGARRSASRLRHTLLAVGDPAAPAADVYRWDAAMPVPGSLVARAGPGTGGDPTFSAIDPDLKRPTTGEFVVGLSSRPSSALRLSVTGLARRQAPLAYLVNVGVPISSYTLTTVPDANADLANPSDDQLLPIYDRRPESFGLDRYLLTNPEPEAATMGAVVVAAQVWTPRVWMLIGATASAAVGSGGHRGFRVIENDQEQPGERFTNPNASTYARGRVFSDRAYTIKWTTVWRLPAAVRIGVIARYQDGQPFSRLVIATGLNQGAEIVQSFANGRSRFAFTGTVDVRLQKGFTLGAVTLDAIVDVYNLPDMHKEVEERVVTGDRFRTQTAVQPPRSMHAGVRLSF